MQSTLKINNLTHSLFTFLQEPENKKHNRKKKHNLHHVLTESMRHTLHHVLTKSMKDEEHSYPLS